MLLSNKPEHNNKNILTEIQPSHYLEVHTQYYFSRASRQKTCPMGRAVSEDCQPASAALLHPVNPLPLITRFPRLNKQRSGNLDTIYHTQ